MASMVLREYQGGLLPLRLLIKPLPLLLIQVVQSLQLSFISEYNSAQRHLINVTHHYD